jgi:O-antigen/teichoic acid export membrane protein
VVTSLDTRESDRPCPNSLERDIITTARGAGFVAAGKFFEFASRFIIALLLARLLGASDYGLYVLAISAAAIFAGLGTFGLDDAMVRYVAILSGRRDQPGVRGTIQVGVGISMLASTLLAAVLFVCAQPIAEGLFDEPRLAPLLQLMAAVVPVLTLSNVLIGVARGFGRMEYGALAENVIQSVVRMALLLVLAVAGSGLDVWAAALIFGFSDLAAGLTLVALLDREVPLSSLVREPARRDVREVFGFALPLWLAGLLRLSRRNFETLLLGASTAASAVGIYAVVSNVNLVSHVCLLSLLVAVKPTLARLHDRRDHDGLVHLYATGTRWALSLTLPFVLVSVLYREQILSVFGEAFAAGGAALVLLSLGELVNAATGVCGPMIDMTGHTRVKLANSVLWTFIVIGANAVLIPRWGLIGAATASLVAIATVNIVSVVEVWLLERLLPYDRSFLKPAAAGAGAFAAGLVLQATLPFGTGVPAAAVQGTVVVALYVVLLLALGLAPEDRLLVDRLLERARTIHAAVQARAAARRPANVSPAVVDGREAHEAARDLPGALSRSPIYIGGLDRSGKTTMAAFLTSHPNIAVPDAGTNMWTYFYGRFGDLGKPANRDRCIEAMLRYSHIRVLEPDPERIRRKFVEGPTTYAHLFSLFLDQFAERAGKPRWGVQTGLIERYADELFAADPATKIVHMVRDPRDRYEGSLALWPNGHGRAGGATARWTYSTRLAEQHLRRHPDGYLVVRYEDMVVHTRDTVCRVCEFVGEVFYEDMLAMPGAPERRARLLARARDAHSGVPLSTEFIGRFRDAIPRHEVAFMQLHAGRLMRAHGYAAEPVELSARERARFVVGWPSQAARMVAWKGVEAMQQRLPALVGRRPDRRLLVDDGGGRSP